MRHRIIVGGYMTSPILIIETMTVIDNIMNQHFLAASGTRVLITPRS